MAVSTGGHVQRGVYTCLNGCFDRWSCPNGVFTPVEMAVSTGGHVQMGCLHLFKWLFRQVVMFKRGVYTCLNGCFDRWSCSNGVFIPV